MAPRRPPSLAPARCVPAEPRARPTGKTDRPGPTATDSCAARLPDDRNDLHPHRPHPLRLPSALRTSARKAKPARLKTVARKASTTPATHRHARPCTTGGPASRRLSRTLSEQQRAATAAASSSNSSEKQQQQRAAAAASSSNSSEQQQQRAAAAISSNSEQRATAAGSSSSSEQQQRSQRQ